MTLLLMKTIFGIGNFKKGSHPSNGTIPIWRDNYLHLPGIVEILVKKRDFFKSVGSLGISSSTSLFGKVNSEKVKSPFSLKQIPEKRDLLNRVRDSLGTELLGDMKKHYYFQMDVSDDCDGCGACVGACTTGALETKEGEDNEVLSFESSSCSGCGLCEEFCFRQFLKVEPHSQ